MRGSRIYIPLPYILTGITAKARFESIGSLLFLGRTFGPSFDRILRSRERLERVVGAVELKLMNLGTGLRAGFRGVRRRAAELLGRSHTLALVAYTQPTRTAGFSLHHVLTRLKDRAFNEPLAVIVTLSGVPGKH